MTAHPLHCIAAGLAAAGMMSPIYGEHEKSGPFGTTTPLSTKCAWAATFTFWVLAATLGME